MRRTPYRIWSPKTITVVGVLVVGICATLVFLLGHRSLMQELQTTLLLIAAALFLFLAVGLYHGVRIRKRDAQVAAPAGVRLEDLTPHMDGQSLADIDCPLEAADGCLHIILSLLLSIVVAVALVLLLWLLLNLALGVVFVLSLGLCWVFSRALRQVFTRSRACRGNLPLSLWYAGLYTCLYTGWLFGLILIGRWVTHR